MGLSSGWFIWLFFLFHFLLALYHRERERERYDDAGLPSLLV